MDGQEEQDEQEEPIKCIRVEGGVRCEEFATFQMEFIGGGAQIPQWTGYCPEHLMEAEALKSVLMKSVVRRIVGDKGKENGYREARMAMSKGWMN